QRNSDQVFLCVLDTFSDCVRYLCGLACAEANDAVAVADNYQRCKLHDTAALNRLCYTVDGYYFLTQFKCRSVNASQKYPSSLEFEAALAGCFSQLFYTAVVNVTAAVKYNLGNTLLESFARNALANLAGCFLVTAKTFKTFIHRRCAYQ